MFIRNGVNKFSRLYLFLYFKFDHTLQKMKLLNHLRRACLLAAFIPMTGLAQDKKVVIRIIQDESVRLDDFQTNLVLRKSAFKFQILLDQVEGVYVFASIRDSVYRFTETSPIRDFSYLKLLELRESDKFNTNKELNISETGWSYWFYNDSTDWHSFNRTAVGVGKTGNVCTKAIKQLYDVANGSVIKLRTMNTPLYLFFIVVKEYDKDGKPVAELMRRKLKIDWAGD